MDDSWVFDVGGLVLFADVTTTYAILNGRKGMRLSFNEMTMMNGKHKKWFFKQQSACMQSNSKAVKSKIKSYKNL